MTTENLISELERILQENSAEIGYYNSDQGMAANGDVARMAAIKSISADSRWINGMLKTIREAEVFVANNPKK